MRLAHSESDAKTGQSSHGVFISFIVTNENCFVSVGPSNSIQLFQYVIHSSALVPSNGRSCLHSAMSPCCLKSILLHYLCRFLYHQLLKARIGVSPMKGHMVSLFFDPASMLAHIFPQFFDKIGNFGSEYDRLFALFFLFKFSIERPDRMVTSMCLHSASFSSRLLTSSGKTARSGCVCNGTRVPS
ncbi:hypothetical protein BpHYR1_044415 [Brachionus plicatilis]|uniref:Uncharacterized protein n=1 Tax=Brachionus plicatilis TaxID=10195 RepID=A0A3M7RGG6_BRAPC|nr:hypothetical protein BpHYR1_044415 [Brachionus plicatilis]